MSPEPTVTIEASGKTLNLSFDSDEDHIASVIRSTGTFYEAEMLADIRSRLFFPVCAVDVGAHVGNHALYFAHVLGLRTFAFEPNPSNFACLAHNLRINGLDQRCVLRQAAVGAAAGRGRSVVSPEKNSGMARFELAEDGPVPVVALDEVVFDETKIDLVKIDVEGWENEVVRGARRTLARHRPLVYVEVALENYGALRAELENANYVCWKRFNVTPTFLFLPRERFFQQVPQA